MEGILVCACSAHADLGLSTEWHYRQLCIELSRKGYRHDEPDGMKQREKSLVFDKVFTALRSQGIKRKEILEQLRIPSDEASNLTFGNNIFMEVVDGGKSREQIDNRSSNGLRLIK